jgi:hypothetical protein
MSDQPTPKECANCGASIPRGAKACPECGADEKTGWRETSIYDGIELPDSAFEDESSPTSPTRPQNRINGIAWYWWVVALAFIFFLVRFFTGL